MPRVTVNPSAALPVEVFDATMRSDVLRCLEAVVNEEPTPAAYEARVDAYLTAANGNATAHDALFNSFTGVWGTLLEQGRHQLAWSLWHRVVAPVLKWEADAPGRAVHKGTPFYCWGVTSILSGDLDGGYALMHRAVEEDARTSGNPAPDTQAFAFATMDSSHMKQAFYPWVKAQAEFVEARLAAYRMLQGCALDLTGLRARLLSRAEHRDLVVAFGHAVARLYRWSRMPLSATTTAFASQLRSELLFGLARVAEDSIRTKSKAKGEFCAQADFLLTNGKIRRPGFDLGKVNGEFNRDFDATIAALVGDTYEQVACGKLNDVERAFALAYGLRNVAAHSTAAMPALNAHFDVVEQALFNVFFLSVERLYH